MAGPDGRLLEISPRAGYGPLAPVRHVRGSAGAPRSRARVPGSHCRVPGSAQGVGGSAEGRHRTTRERAIGAKTRHRHEMNGFETRQAPAVIDSTPSPIRSVAFASLIGTTIEWYDFFLYGTAAALVFNRLYFPMFDPLAGTLAAFGTYAVGFVARPIGGIVIGHFGDRIGRKSMLILTLTVMGIATFLIG